MALTFLHSRQPGLEHPDDEAEDEMPMARCGSVRAFSHLPGRADGPPQVMVRGSGGMRPDNSMTATNHAWPFLPRDEAADGSFSPASRDAEEEPTSEDEDPEGDAPSFHTPQNLAPDTAQAAPRTSGLMMRPRPMPAEYARRQALGRPLILSSPHIAAPVHAAPSAERSALRWPQETPNGRKKQRLIFCGFLRFFAAHDSEFPPHRGTCACSTLGRAVSIEMAARNTKRSRKTASDFCGFLRFFAAHDSEFPPHRGT